MAAHVLRAVAVAAQPKEGPVPGRQMAAHVQRAVGAAAQPAMERKVAGRQMAAHVQQAVGKAAQPKAVGAVPGRQMAAHVQRAVAAAAQPKTMAAAPQRQVAAHVKRAVAAAAQPRMVGPAPGRQTTQLQKAEVGPAQANVQQPLVGRASKPALQTPARPPVQRTIVVNGDTKWVEKQLQVLAGWDATVVVKGDNTVGLVSSGDDPSPGVELLTRLITSGNEVTINTTEEKVGAKQSVLSVTDASDPRTGSGSRITISKTFEQKSIVMKDGELVEENTPSWIILAHELIHAERSARGGRVKKGDWVDYSVKGKWGEVEVDKKHFTMREETETVGLTPNSDITENQIREFFGMPKIALYESEHERFLGAKTKSKGRGKHKRTPSGY